jgi:phosphoglucomutase
MVDRRTKAFTDAVYQRTQEISVYRIVESSDIDLSRIGRAAIGDMAVSIIDPVADSCRASGVVV